MTMNATQRHRTCLLAAAALLLGLPAAHAHDDPGVVDMRPAAVKAQTAKPETYYGLMTPEVAKIRLQKMGASQVTKLDAITPSQEIFRAEVMKEGKARTIEINRKTGETREVQ